MPVENDLFLTFDCDSMSNSIKNDSIVCYSLLLNNFAMKYSKNGQIDIQIKNEKAQKIKFNFAFVKKGYDVYMLTMCPIHDVAFLGSDSIIDLIK